MRSHLWMTPAFLPMGGLSRLSPAVHASCRRGCIRGCPAQGRARGSEIANECRVGPFLLRENLPRTALREGGRPGAWPQGLSGCPPARAGVLKFIVSHPLNRGRPLSTLVRLTAGLAGTMRSSGPLQKCLPSAGAARHHLIWPVA